VLIEWGERFLELMPTGHYEVRLEVHGDGRRVSFSRE